MYFSLSISVGNLIKRIELIIKKTKNKKILRKKAEIPKIDFKIEGV